MFPSPGNCVGRREECKCQCRLALREEGIADPFEDFAKEVGARHIFEHSAIGDLVALLAGSPKISQNVIGLQIYKHPEQKEWNT